MDPRAYNDFLDGEMVFMDNNLLPSKLQYRVLTKCLKSSFSLDISARRPLLADCAYSPATFTVI